MLISLSIKRTAIPHRTLLSSKLELNSELWREYRAEVQAKIEQLGGPGNPQTIQAFLHVPKSNLHPNTKDDKESSTEFGINQWLLQAQGQTELTFNLIEVLSFMPIVQTNSYFFPLLTVRMAHSLN